MNTSILEKHADRIDPPAAVPVTPSTTSGYTKSSSSTIPSSTAASPGSERIFGLQKEDKLNELIKPFVSDICFRSVEKSARPNSTVKRFRPYNCYAAVLFVDLSNYSRITAAIAHRGAHVLSNIVNEYLERILLIVHKYGGDVVKFAGDAILVVWDGAEDQQSVLACCAAKCVVELQQKVGSHAIPGISDVFQMHCGLCLGKLESDIYDAKNVDHMQRLFHLVRGDSLREISRLVELSKAGETCISLACCESVQGGVNEVIVDPVIGHDGDEIKLLRDVNIDEKNEKIMQEFIDQKKCDRLLHRKNKNPTSFHHSSGQKKATEEEFVYDSILHQLRHGGYTPTQIAQMRNLCVLFIAMTSNFKPSNWLKEVQEVLDRRHCPIVQIIDDDKGMHIVAAVNLYEAIPEMYMFGLAVCRDLEYKQVGCAIGMAMGEAFCGVTGSQSVACRWDITGACVVRAARLMQYAKDDESRPPTMVEKRRTKVAIDQSVYIHVSSLGHLEVWDEGYQMKGTVEPVIVYTLSNDKSEEPFFMEGPPHPLEPFHGGKVHDNIVEKLHEAISGDSPCSCAIVTGLPLVGKKVVCQRAAERANLVSFKHVCDPSAGLLQLARTIALYFKSSELSNDLQDLAIQVLDRLNNARISAAHDDCVELLNMALDKGLRYCFVLDRIHFLDDNSLSIIEECLKTQQSNLSGSIEGGKICFLCTHVSLYGQKSAEHVVVDINPGSHQIPVFTVAEATNEELRSALQKVCDIVVNDQLLDTHAQASGNCIGYFIQRVRAIQNISKKLLKEGNRPYVETNNGQMLTIPFGSITTNRSLPVTQISVDSAMRYFQIYDLLPPLLQTFVKVLSIGTGRGLYKLPQDIMWQALNDLIVNKVTKEELDSGLNEMKDKFLIHIIDTDDDDQKVVSFRCPPLADVAHEVCTPDQINCIKNVLLNRLKQRSCDVSLIVASIHHMIN